MGPVNGGDVQLQERHSYPSEGHDKSDTLVDATPIKASLLWVQPQVGDQKTGSLLSAHHPVGGGSNNRESACNAGDPGSIPGSGRCPGEWLPTQYSCLENSLDRGAWWAAVMDCKGSDMTEQLTPSLFHPLGEKTVTQWAEDLPLNEFLLHARFCSMQLEYELSLGLNL